MDIRKTNLRRGLRYLGFFTGDVISITLAMFLAFFLRFDGAIPAEYMRDLYIFVAAALAVKMPLFFLDGIYNISWSHFGLYEVVAVFRAISLSSLFLAVFILIEGYHFPFQDLPKSIIPIDYLFTLLFVGGLRSLMRIRNHMLKRNGKKSVLIVGAGDAGEQIVREILRDHGSNISPIGFIDDDPAKMDIHIHGVKVLGGREKMGELVRKYRVNEVLIAMPSARARTVRDIVEVARSAGVNSLKILPSLSDLLSGRVRLAHLRDVSVEDLLGRKPVEIDTKSIEDYINNKIVLVTGAAGFIGSELSLQVAKFNPSKLVLIDLDETALFYLGLKLEERFPNLPMYFYAADVRDRLKMEKVFSTHLPHVVFHAAAYKHVPIMEKNADEAVKNNVFGTLSTAETALVFGTEKFVLISTDKAVNPASVMGATKRVAEMIVLKLNERGDTSFVAVRFGNVLGSRGSVLPIFQEQIKKGGPVTVTHPEMKRYFMSVTEAVLLVLQAGSMGNGGEVFVLDMGEPIRIVDLARETIRLSGFEPDKDIPIVFTGIRPGEKLFEELLTAEEGTERTKNRKIFKARLSFELQNGEFMENLIRLEALSRIGDNEDIVELLEKMIPTYTPHRTFPSLFERKERYTRMMMKRPS